MSDEKIEQLVAHMKSAVEGISRRIDSLTQLAAPGTVMEQAVPSNPYQHPDSAADSVVTGVTKGTVVGTRGGWAYNAATGEIWANTNKVGENTW